MIRRQATRSSLAARIGACDDVHDASLELARLSRASIVPTKEPSVGESRHLACSSLAITSAAYHLPSLSFRPGARLSLRASVRHDQIALPLGVLLGSSAASFSATARLTVRSWTAFLESATLTLACGGRRTRLAIAAEEPNEPRKAFGIARLRGAAPFQACGTPASWSAGSSGSYRSTARSARSRAVVRLSTTTALAPAARRRSALSLSGTRARMRSCG
jgi:hypothetical protein